jgi:hypothetical protein
MKVSGGSEPRQTQASDVSHLMKPAAAVARLCARYGQVDARKIALKQQRKAKRARSKKRFVFWGEVARKLADGS